MPTVADHPAGSMIPSAIRDLDVSLSGRQIGIGNLIPVAAKASESVFLNTIALVGDLFTRLFMDDQPVSKEGRPSKRWRFMSPSTTWAARTRGDSPSSFAPSAPLRMRASSWQLANRRLVASACTRP